MSVFGAVVKVRFDVDEGTFLLSLLKLKLVQ
jgi:hypothetical protein